MKTMTARGRQLIKLASTMACCFLASCFGGYNYGLIGTATTRSIELPGEKGTRVRGEDCRSRIFVFPTGFINIRNAIDDALKKGGGDFLVDAVIDSEDRGIPLVYMRECWIAEGTIFKVRPKTVGASPTMAHDVSQRDTPAPSEDVVNCVSGGERRWVPRSKCD